MEKLTKFQLIKLYMLFASLTFILFITTNGYSQLADSPWPISYHDPQWTQRSPYLGPQIGEIKWTLGVPKNSSPIIGSDGTIYLDTLEITVNFSGVTEMDSDGNVI